MIYKHKNLFWKQFSKKTSILWLSDSRSEKWCRPWVPLRQQFYHHPSPFPQWAKVHPQPLHSFTAQLVLSILTLSLPLLLSPLLSSTAQGLQGSPPFVASQVLYSTPLHSTHSSSEFSLMGACPLFKAISLIPMGYGLRCIWL